MIRRSGQNARDFMTAARCPSISDVESGAQQANSFAVQSEVGRGRALSPSAASYSAASYSSRSSRGREGEELIMQKLSEITAENQAMATEIRSESSSP